MIEPLRIRKFGFMAVALFFCNVISAQTTACDSTLWAKPGTYEIVIVPGTVESTVVSNVVLPEYVLCEIETLRENNNTVEYALNNSILIRIYPNKMINIKNLSQK